MEQPFFIPESFFDADISWRAKGLYACIIGAQGFFSDTVNESDVDMDSILARSPAKKWQMDTIIRELRDAGFLIKSDAIEFVYLIHSRWSGFYKIGYTKGSNVNDRITSMRTGDPSLTIITKCKRGKDYEKRLHTAFSEKRVEREWFRLSMADVDLIKAEMAKTR